MKPVAVNQLSVKIFADGADKKGMLEMHANPFIKGFTTNPTLMRKAGISVSPQQVTAASEPVADLVGEIAPYQAPAPKTAHVQPAQRSQPRRRPNRGGERAKAAHSGQRSGGGRGHRAGARTGASRSY